MTPTGQGVTVSEHDPALDLDALVRTVVGEAGAEPVEGQKAVAHVAMNRARASGQPVAKIVSDPNQFQGYSTPRAQNISPASPTYQRVLQAVMPVYHGEEEDPTGGATNFIAPKLQAAEGRPMPNIQNGVPIGNHVFYSGGWKPESAEPPSVAELLNQAAANMSSTGAQAPAPDAPPTAEPPSVEELIAQLPPDQRPPAPTSNAPAATSAKPVSAAQQAANVDIAKQAHPAESPDVFLNSLTGNFLPTIDAGVMAAGTGLHNALAGVGIGKKLPYGMGETFQAARSSEQNALDAYEKAKPYTSTLANIAGFVTPGGVVEHAAGAAGHMLASAAPRLAENAAGRLASHAVSNAAGGAVAGTGSGVSRGEDAGGVAQDAAGNAALAGALAPVGAAANKIANNAGRFAPLVAPAVGGALGAAAGVPVSALTGLPMGETVKGMAEVGALGGMRFKSKPETNPGIAPTGKDTRAVLDRLATQLPDVSTLSNAHPAALTAEALGPQAPRFIKEATANGGTASDDITDALEQRRATSGDRIVQALKAAGAPDAATAGQDVEAATDAARKGPGKEAYTKALTGRGVWSPELQALVSTGPVRKALSRAYDTLGENGKVPNPDLPPPGSVQPQERMTAQELRERAATQAGKAPGAETTNEDILDYIRTAKPDTFQLAPKAPATIPTDEALDLAKKHLDKMSKAPGPDQFHYQEAARAFTPALKTAIGSDYAKALEVAGDYLSNQEAAEKGAALWSRGKNSEDGATFAKRVAGETEAQREFGLKGYLKGLYSQIENGKFSPSTITESPFHQKVLQTYLGPENAAKVMDALKTEAGFERNHKQLLRAAKPGAPPAPTEDPGLLGAVLVGAEKGFHPMAMARGYFTGKAANVTKEAVEQMLKRPLTNGERNALGKILAQPATETADMLRRHQDMKRAVPLNDSVLNLLSERAKRIAPAGVASAGLNAFHGLKSDERTRRSVP